MRMSGNERRKRLVVLTGAGMSAESGLKTFRDAGGLWEEYDVMEVASIEGWHRNPKLVTEFYNQRREQLAHAEPNLGHRILTGVTHPPAAGSRSAAGRGSSVAAHAAASGWRWPRAWRPGR